MFNLPDYRVISVNTQPMPASLLRAGDTLTGQAAHRLAKVFVADDPTGRLQAAGQSTPAVTTPPRIPR
jgi:hypothetical protein